MTQPVETLSGEKRVSDDPDVDDLQRRMTGAVEVLRQEFSGLRAGRASASLLDHVKVDAYGTESPLNQVSTINVPEPRLITVQVWDKGLVKGSAGSRRWPTADRHRDCKAGVGTL